MKWDVPKSEPVEFFDRTLSYELTGYRPIDMENGLDFNVDLFREDAITKDKTGKYTEYLPGSKSYAEFWEERKRRCTEGYTVGKYKITGDNYFFINFYRMISAKNGVSTFPTFTNVQYEWFHYIALAEEAGFDCGALKPRGIKSCPIN